MSNTSPDVPRVHFRVVDICTNLCLLKIKILVNRWLEGAGHILYIPKGAKCTFARKQYPTYEVSTSIIFRVNECQWSLWWFESATYDITRNPTNKIWRFYLLKIPSVVVS